jgi:hypothetical protein
MDKAVCGPILECAIDIDCLALTDRTAILYCGVPCVYKADVFDPLDPRIAPILPVVDCFLAICQPVCGGPP